MQRLLDVAAKGDSAVTAAKILVVDDVALNVKLLADLLAVNGYRTCTATSGAEALERIAGEQPDLVLLDVMMPGMSGYEVCRAIRADPAHAMLPVVLVTALDPAEERAKGLDAGADDFLSKPVEPGRAAGAGALAAAHQVAVRRGAAPEARARRAESHARAARGRRRRASSRRWAG